jgi:hypothetical protein
MALNGQEITLDMTAGNPFLQNIFETKDGRFVVLSAVYVDLCYQWTALLGCSVQIDDVRAAVKRWNSYGASCSLESDLSGRLQRSVAVVSTSLVVTLVSPMY